MNIRKEMIGSSCHSKKLGRSFVIEEGKEKLYKALGFDVFTKEKKTNAKSKKSDSGTSDGNGDGTGND